MNKVIKIFLIIILVLISLVIVFFSLPKILGLITSDISSVDETGLQLNRKDITDSDNAFFDLEKSAQVINLPKEQSSSITKFLSGESWDDKMINEILSNNIESLSHFSDASKKSAVADPIMKDLSKVDEYTPMPNLDKWRNVSRISSLKALSLSQKGLYTEAIEESFKSIKVGQLIIDSPDRLLTHLIGRGIKAQGLSSLEKIINESELSKIDLQKYSNELSTLRDSGQGLKDVFIVEYNALNNFYNYIGAGEIKDDINNSELPNFVKKNAYNNYYFRINETKQLNVNRTLEQIKNADIACGEIEKISDPKKLAPDSFVLLYLTENAAGKILQDVIGSNLKSVFKKRCEIETRLDSAIKLIESK